MSRVLFCIEPDSYRDGLLRYMVLVCNQPPTSTQPLLLGGMGSEYQPETPQSAVLLCGWEAKAGMAHSTFGVNMWVAGKTVIPR